MWSVTSELRKMRLHPAQDTAFCQQRAMVRAYGSYLNRELEDWVKTQKDGIVRAYYKQLQGLLLKQHKAFQIFKFYWDVNRESQEKGKISFWNALSQITELGNLIVMGIMHFSLSLITFKNYLAYYYLQQWNNNNNIYWVFIIFSGTILVSPCILYVIDWMLMFLQNSC